MYKIIGFEDIEKGIPYDFINEPSSHEQTFVIGFHGDAVRGMYYNSNSQSYVYLKYQENIGDVINTCVHESIHAAIDHVSSWEDEEIDDNILDEKDAFYVDDPKEHWSIQKIQWIDEII